MTLLLNSCPVSPYAIFYISNLICQVHTWKYVTLGFFHADLVPLSLWRYYTCWPRSLLINIYSQGLLRLPTILYTAILASKLTERIHADSGVCLAECHSRAIHTYRQLSFHVFFISFHPGQVVVKRLRKCHGSQVSQNVQQRKEELVMEKLNLTVVREQGKQ